jgi:ABC-type phosphate transport system substrate-binding protein
MKRRPILRAIGAAVATLGLTLATAPARADDGLAVIAHPGVRALDAEAIRRVYSGRMVELDGQPLRPLQLAVGHPLRRRFAAAVLQQSDEDFIAYWTVRRYIGKGAPPRELGSSAEVVAQVIATPGAIGYVDATDLKPGLHVLLRR